MRGIPNYLVKIALDSPEVRAVNAKIDAARAEVVKSDPAPATGTPNRKQLAREWQHRHDSLVNQIHLSFDAERKEAIRAAVLRIRRENESSADKLKKLAFRHLRKMSFRRERGKAGSFYYRLGEIRVRISDHWVPMTPEREWNASNGGFTWADASMQIIIGQHTSCMDVLRKLVLIRRAACFND